MNEKRNKQDQWLREQARVQVDANAVIRNRIADAMKRADKAGRRDLAADLQKIRNAAERKGGITKEETYSLYLCEKKLDQYENTLREKSKKR
jgi:hypothetical protein